MQLNPIPCHTHRKIINIFLVKKTTDINCYISKSRPGSHHSHQKAQKRRKKQGARALNNRYRELVVSCDSLQNQRRTDGTFILRSVLCSASISSLYHRAIHHCKGVAQAERRRNLQSFLIVLQTADDMKAPSNHQLSLKKIVVTGSYNWFYFSIFSFARCQNLQSKMIMHACFFVIWDKIHHPNSYEK